VPRHRLLLLLAIPLALATRLRLCMVKADVIIFTPIVLSFSWCLNQLPVPARLVSRFLCPNNSIIARIHPVLELFSVL